MTRTHGRHELGQNFLVDPSVIDTIIASVAAWPDDVPLLELGPGNGALTAALAELGRPVTAVELDGRRASQLRAQLGHRVDVVHGDLLDADFGVSVDLVSNVPFGITTPLLRRALASPEWRHAIFLVQWEVARKRAGVGGTTMLTAQWWPWFDFSLGGRVPADSFRPRPSVDGGLLCIARRTQPLVPQTERAAYQRFVGDVFAGRGRGVVDIAGRVVGRRTAARWAADRAIRASMLPRDLGADEWSALHDMARRDVREERVQSRAR
jgi:23S rRNA (adenine-N6)-dimethyltransferase